MVTTPPAVLTGQVDIRAESVVVVGSGMTGLETAELLSDRARNNAVLVLEAAPRIAPGVYGSNRNGVTAVLELNNVVLLCNRTLTRIGADRVWFRDSQTGEEFVYPCDRVVLALGTTPPVPMGTGWGDLPKGHPGARGDPPPGADLGRGPRGAITGPGRFDREWPSLILISNEILSFETRTLRVLAVLRTAPSHTKLDALRAIKTKVF